MSFSSYAEYKETGVQWLGAIPSHWRVDRIKQSIQVCRNGIWGDEPRGDVNDIVCVRVADFDWPHLRVALTDPTIRNVTATERKERTLSKGDLVLEKSGGGEKQLVGRVVLYDEDTPAVCSNFTAKMSLSHGMSPSYWRYLHAAAYHIRLNYPSIKQTSGIQNLDQSSYFDERCAYPPSHEQEAIATFLDHETAKIDALVEEQERLIALLKEKRQAVISHAVTKGLDPNVPMKDSGVEWIGAIPTRWQAMKLKFLLQTTGDSLRPGPFGSQIKGEDFVENSEFRVYNQSTVIGADFTRSAYIKKDKFQELSAFSVRAGDLLLTSRGTIGKAAIAPARVEPGVIHPCLIRVRLNENLACKQFIQKIIADTHIATEQLRLSSNATTIDVVYSEPLSNTAFPLPPLDEQRSISQSLEEELNKFRLLIETSEKVVALLHERRAALISAAVTGKIDVRNWKPSDSSADIEQTLPMAADEPASYG